MAYSTALRDYYTGAYIKHLAEKLSVILANQDAMILHEEVQGSSEWQHLELKARMSYLAQVIHRFLPEDYEVRVEILKLFIVAINNDEHKYESLLSMFIPEYIAIFGLQQWQISMEALSFFTSHGASAEFAIRPFINQDFDQTLEQMYSWSSDSNLHIRRLASEGCRPRLPWGGVITKLCKDPAPILPILRNMRGDESAYVRKSVANNLNDISKDNPEIVRSIAIDWYGANINTNWIVKHGSRTLLKKADDKLLKLFGAYPVRLEQAELAIATPVLVFGSDLVFSFKGHIEEDLPPKLRIEYAIDFVKADGSLSRKLFKISEFTPQKTHISFVRKHKFIPYSTRKYYPGMHGLAVIINGNIVAEGRFLLEM